MFTIMPNIKVRKKSYINKMLALKLNFISQQVIEL
jgi:hypothetical protein